MNNKVVRKGRKPWSSPGIWIFHLSCLILPTIFASNHMFKDHSQREKYVLDFIEQMTNYDIRIGSFDILWEETCKLPDYAFRCKGNNPNSPYVTWKIPDISGQNTEPYSIRMRKDEAIVVIGVTPPLAKYFGFTFYVNHVEYKFGDSNGGYASRYPTVKAPEDGRSHIQASLEDPINPNVMNVSSDGSYDDAFDKDFILISSPDQKIVSEIKLQFTKIGVLNNVFNVQGLPSSIVSFGLEKESDVLSPLCRIAFINDEDEKNKYLRDIPWTLLRITPKLNSTNIIPFGRAKRKIPSKNNSQVNLQKSLTKLAFEVKKQMKGKIKVEARSKLSEANPDRCIDKRTKCFFENTDASYFVNFPGHAFPDNAEYVVIGVNHVEAGYARYSSVTLYGARDFLSIASFSSENDMKGSADRYLLNDPLKDNFYALTFKRNCTGEIYCVDVPEDDVLFGLETYIFMERAYMDPNGTKGPDPSLMLPFRVIYNEETSHFLRKEATVPTIRERLFPEEARFPWPLDCPF